MVKEYLVIKPIQDSELLSYENYTGFLFKNQDGVYSIIDDVEDIIKSNQYFGAKPVNAIIVVECGNFQISDKLLATCENENLFGKTFEFIGYDSEMEGVILLTDRNGALIKTTEQVFSGAYKVLRAANRKDKENLINKNIRTLF